MESNLMRLIADKQENGEELALITVLSSNLMKTGSPGTMMVVDQYGLVIGGDLGDPNLQEMARKEAERSMGKGISRKVLLKYEDKQIEIFINYLAQKEKLIIVGSGNLVMDIYQFAVNLGYSIIIVDNMPETLTRERFPLAQELLLGDIAEQLGAIDITDDTSIVIASYHHESDIPALLAVIESSARYIGILGNKRKVTAYFGILNEMGIADKFMNRVFIPVGLDIGGQRTADIALSVMAEVQAVKHGKSGGFLSTQQLTTGIERREELF